MASRGHKLLPQSVQKLLPDLYTTDGQGNNAIAQVRYFSIASNWEWYATEFDGKDTFFGLVKGLDTELGYFSLSELEKVTFAGGVPAIERDLYFSPKPLSQVRG